MLCSPARTGPCIQGPREPRYPDIWLSANGDQRRVERGRIGAGLAGGLTGQLFVPHNSPPFLAAYTSADISGPCSVTSDDSERFFPDAILRRSS